MSPGGWWVCEVRGEDGIWTERSVAVCPLLGVGDSPIVSISERKVGGDDDFLIVDHSR